MFMVLAVTANFIIQSFITLTQIKAGTIEDPPSSIVISFEIYEFLNTAMVLVGDFVICWRTWVLLSHDSFCRFALAVLMIGSIGANTADTIFDILNIGAKLNGSFIVLDWLGIAMSLLVNMSATALTGWKAWAHYCTMREASIWRQSRVKKILLLFVESGAFFLVIQCFALVGEIISSSAKVNVTTGLSLVAPVAANLWICGFAGFGPQALGFDLQKSRLDPTLEAPA
ncbi:hypothetical protein BDP27DRAFT_1433600 [Rhodocollybia butyracea]|uniref:Uncharacterized protein n=1 Tax=Rhodocollybia butyracea TaxID=206335 RepID=A0A9P5P7E6_9AGAR|nr:hypothetical protein BDP27DRAFT_1433600 [Rhodocollybia butyracea]